MDFKAILEERHSKETTNTIVNEVGNSANKFAKLMFTFKEGPAVITQRAAWPLSYIGQNHPELLTPYYPLFINLLKQENKHNAINRNVLRALQNAQIPEDYQGAILDICFQLLNSPKEPIAVKIFSMSLIENLAKLYPEIIPELKMSIEALLPNSSAGVKSRGNKILRILKK